MTYNHIINTMASVIKRFQSYTKYSILLAKILWFLDVQHINHFQPRSPPLIYFSMRNNIWPEICLRRPKKNAV